MKNELVFMIMAYLACACYLLLKALSEVIVFFYCKQLHCGGIVFLAHNGIDLVGIAN